MHFRGPWGAQVLNFTRLAKKKSPGGVSEAARRTFAIFVATPWLTHPPVPGGRAPWPRSSQAEELPGRGAPWPGISLAVELPSRGAGWRGRRVAGEPRQFIYIYIYIERERERGICSVYTCSNIFGNLIKLVLLLNMEAQTHKLLVVHS